MNIPKAIERLEGRPRCAFWLISGETENAIKLGIEALKRVEHYRKAFVAECDFKLPGETKENP